MTNWCCHAALTPQSEPGVTVVPAPDAEILVARDGQDVADHLRALTPERARRIGQAALARVRAEHTYAQRAEDVDRLLKETASAKRERSLA